MKYLQIILLLCLLQACQPTENSVDIKQSIQSERDSITQWRQGDTVSEVRLKNLILRLRHKLGAPTISINFDSAQVFIGNVEANFYKAQTDSIIYIFSDDTTKTLFKDKTTKKAFWRVSELSKKNLQAYRFDESLYIHIWTEQRGDKPVKPKLLFNLDSYDVFVFEKISADTWVLSEVEDSRGNQDAKDHD